MNNFTDAIQSWPHFVFIQGEINNPGFTPDIIYRYSAPKTAVITVVPIVTHDKQVGLAER